MVLSKNEDTRINLNQKSIPALGCVSLLFECIFYFLINFFTTLQNGYEEISFSPLLNRICGNLGYYQSLLVSKFIKKIQTRVISWNYFNFSLILFDALDLFLEWLFRHWRKSIRNRKKTWKYQRRRHYMVFQRGEKNSPNWSTKIINGLYGISQKMIYYQNRNLQLSESHLVQADLFEGFFSHLWEKKVQLSWLLVVTEKTPQGTINVCNTFSGSV